MPDPIASEPVEQGPQPAPEAPNVFVAMSAAPTFRANRSVSVPYVDPGVADPGSDKTGRYGMYLAIIVFVLSVATSILIGFFGTTIYHYHQTVITNGQSSSSVGFNARPNEIASIVQIALGTILGIGALVMGIIAVAKKRGRRFGVIAIIVAGLAPIVSAVVFAIIGLAAGHNVYQ